MDPEILKRLEEFWKTQWCGCSICDSFPDFHEIKDFLVATNTRGLYWCPCINKGHHDLRDHHGHFVAWKEEYSRGGVEYLERVMTDLKENHPEIFEQIGK